MGWITRRIAGSITFTIVVVLLGSYAALQGWLVGGVSLATTTGIVILGIAALCSLAVTSHMKRQDQTKKAWKEWQDYYVRAYPQYYRPR
jgi:hypothetical protein